ncbi:MAG: hypothetical protein FVQ83_11575 [Chloroflexi bacterium]|nr:hypothetical protein [Chloroflexota bacterium]
MKQRWLFFFLAVLLESCGTPPAPPTQTFLPAPTTTNTAVPTTTIQPTPTDSETPVLISGEVIITISLYDTSLQKPAFDLDNNVIALPNSQDDDFIMGFTQGGTDHFLVFGPVNGASGDHYGTTEPGYQGCNQIINTFIIRAFPETFLGSYACFLTNEGNLAQVFIADQDCDGYSTCIITLQFIVWRFTEMD